jgi:hypothetical protein
MQKQWVGKNVDLKLLSECIEDFFKDKGFRTRIDESAGKYTISWAPQRVRNMRGAMSASVLGNSNDFIVEIVASERTRGSIRLGMLTAAFGGGYLALRGLKAKEILEKIEKEFWIYIEEKVANLTGSAKKP